MDIVEHLRARHEQHRRHLWAIVLAGGEGVRLRPLVRHVCGDERPNYWTR